MVLQKFAVFFTPDFIADHGNGIQPDLGRQSSDVFGRVNAAPTRLNHNDQFINGLGGSPPEVFDTGFHVQHHDFIPGQHHMHHQGTQQGAFRTDTACPAFFYASQAHELDIFKGC